MLHRKGIIHCAWLLVQIHFIQGKQFNETNVTSHVFKNVKFEDIFLMLPRATENAVASHIQPAGLW